VVVIAKPKNSNQKETGNGKTLQSVREQEEDEYNKKVGQKVAFKTTTTTDGHKLFETSL
jgi:hypothetical protein